PHHRQLLRRGFSDLNPLVSDVDEVLDLLRCVVGASRGGKFLISHGSILPCLYVITLKPSGAHASRSAVDMNGRARTPGCLTMATGWSSPSHHRACLRRGRMMCGRAPSWTDMA